MTALALFSLFNALWQSALLAALVALTLHLIPRRNAATTCAIWSATYVLIAALPAIDFVLARPVTISMIAQPAAAPGLLPALPVSEPGISSQRAVLLVAVPDAPRARVQRRSEASSPAALVTPLTAAFDAVPVLNRATAEAERVAAPVLALWLAVASALLCRLAWSYAVVLRLKRGARRIAPPYGTVDLARGRRVDLGVSPLVRVPCAIGFLHPMIVLPEELAETLEPADLARVIVHEHAHLRRYDDWFNTLQRVAAAILFFHPALHYVARRIELDREVACDDEVVDAVGEPLEYARCLTKIVDRHVRSARLSVVPGFFFGRSQVIARVDRLISFRRNISPRVARYGAVVAIAIVVSAVALARLQVPVIAAEKQDDTVATHVRPRPPAHVRAATAHHVRAMTPAEKAAAKSYVVDDEAEALDEPALRALRLRVRALPHVVSIPQIVVLPRTPPLPHVAPLPRVALMPQIAALQRVAPMASPAPMLRTVIRLRESDDRDDVQAAIAEQVRAATQAATEATRQASVQANIAAVRVQLADAEGRPHVDLLDALANNGYPRPSVDELIALGNHGVTGSYVAAMTPLLPSRPTIQQLIALTDEGIGPAYVRDMAAAGYPHLTMDQLVTLRNAGVTPRFVKHLSDHGYRNLSVDQLVKLAESGL